MSAVENDTIVGNAVVIEAGYFAGECGRVLSVSASGRTLDVLIPAGVVTVRRTSVEVYA